MTNDEIRSLLSAAADKGCAPIDPQTLAYAAPIIIAKLLAEIQQVYKALVTAYAGLECDHFDDGDSDCDVLHYT